MAAARARGLPWSFPPEDTLELVGRHQELEIVAAVLEDARGGRARSLAFVGEPGIGKTALLDAAALSAQASGFDVVRASGASAEQELPYAGLLSLLRPLRSHADTLPPAQREALDAALDTGAASASRFAVGAATLGVLASSAEQRPLVVIVDDHHWLDQPTRDALAFALRRLVADAVALILAARPEGRAALDRTTDTIWDVTPLDREASELVVALGRDPLDEGARAAVIDAAHGNPLALLELPLRLSAGQRSGAEPLPPSLAGGRLVAEAFASTAAALPEPCRVAMAAASLLEGDAIRDLQPVLELLGLSVHDLEDAEADGLLHIHSGALTFRHPLVRSAALEVVDDATRRRIHGAFASVVAPGERRALHLAEAASAPDEEVARALESAAAAAPAVTAAALLARASDLSPEHASRARRRSAAATRALEAGRLDHARSLAEEALSLDGADRGTLLRTLGQVARDDRPPTVAVDLLLEAAAELRETDPDLVLETLGEAFQVSLATGDPALPEQIADRLVSVAGGRSRRPRVCDLVEGIVAMQQGDNERGISLLQRFLDDPEGAEPTQNERDRGLRAVACLWLDDHRRAFSELERPVAEARRSGRLSALPRLLAHAGFAHARLGRFEAGYATLVEALSLADELGQLVVACDVANVLAGLEARLGLHDACREHAERSVALATELGLGWFAGHARTQLALSALGSGSPGQAVEILEELHAGLRARGVVEAGEFGYADLIEALVRVGRREDAAQACVEYEGLNTGTALTFERALTLRSGALVADDEHACALFERSLATIPATAPFERARTHLLFGERLRRMGQRRAAREQLRRAEELFEQLGSTGWAERCRVELRASGARLRRGPEARDELTPQELQVALEVARGRTNREIAQTLFLSPKTVEFHLTRIYRKLDLHARAELVARYADQV